jgi:hypothetical protein
MGTFWLKIAGLVIVILIGIVLVSVFTSSNRQTATKPREDRPEQKTVYDQFKEDDEKFGVKYESGKAAGLSSETQGAEGPQPTPQTSTPLPPKPTFRKLSLEEEVEAQRLFEMAKAERKMGRLPVMGYKKMVDYCREIIRRWPDSEYAFQSKRMLADIPERYHEMYHVTKEELDLSGFYKNSK